MPKIAKRYKHLTSLFKRLRKPLRASVKKYIQEKINTVSEDEIVLKFNNEYEYHNAINEIFYVITKVDDSMTAFEEVIRILSQFQEEE
jgi:hypothetical protein